jgi:FkbM family methyltransferase
VGKPSGSKVGQKTGGVGLENSKGGRLTKKIRFWAGLILPLLFLSAFHGCSRPNWLVRKYGPKLYSQYNEELIIRDFFQDMRNGFFVDIGASDYRKDSTTYYLERHLGWRGIAVDAIAAYEAGYLEHRKNTRFFNFFVSDRSDDQLDFYFIPKNQRMSSGSESWAKKGGAYEKIKIPTITLNELLKREGVSHIDLLSMDIENEEPIALAGFDIDAYRPALVCIEAHKEVRQQILDYFAKHRYGLIERYKSVDRVNFYFSPLGPGPGSVVLARVTK